MRSLIAPGKLLFEEELPNRGLTVEDAQRALGLGHEELAEFFAGRVRITPEIAQKLENWLGSETGLTAESWFVMQRAYDRRVPPERRGH